ncbi:rhodanese-like domain-containing protein [Frondihabitans cladoniiphilus]|uniref:Rhodanese-like domain-containing protein n=1 Tax=Frondihabitans cladoniiphilus TaxID=715785 RepID=A0ABP8VNR5_9MICO
MSDGSTTGAPTAGGREAVTADEAIALVSAGAYLLDVREQHEWDSGHAPDAHMLPMSELGTRLSEVPDDREVLVVCHIGGRSARVTAALRENGFDAIDVLGGMVAWQHAEGELTSENGSEPQVG